MGTRPRSVLARDQCSRHLCRGRCAPRLYKKGGFGSRRRIGGGAVHPSVSEQSVMIDKSELLRVPAFADLPDDQIAWFLSNSEEVRVAAGDTYARQGDPADWMFVILEGQFQWRGEFGGETIVLSTKPGDVTGVLPFSRMKQFTVTGRAVTDGRVLKFPASLFSELVQKMPELTTRLVGLMSDRIRETTRLEQQRDRLVSLGKLSAGVCHESNKSRSAGKRGTSPFRDSFKKIKDANHQLGQRELTSA